MNRFQRCLLILLACVLPLVAVASDLTVTQKRELTVFGLKTLGVNAGVQDIKNDLSLSEIEEMVATGLNINGHLCARITSIRPLNLRSKYEVTCIMYRGGTATKTYVVDALNGVAFVP